MKIRFILPYLWLCIPAFLYLSPFLAYPAFNIIDDGASLYLAQRLVTAESVAAVTDVLIEDQVGRFRPVYHLSLTLIYALVGFQPFVFWLAQAIILSLTLIGMACFLYRTTNRYWLSTLLPLTLLLSPTVSQNFYRLGTAEPKQMFFWVLMLLVLSSVANRGWSVRTVLATSILFVLALMTKETSIVFAGMVGLIAIWRSFINRKIEWSSWGQVGLLGIAICLFYIVLPKAGSYSSGFQVVPIDMWQRLLIARLEYASIFFPLLGALITDGLYHWLNWRNNDSFNKTHFLWSALLVSQLFLVLIIGILPWQHQLPRYYFPIYLMSIVYIGVVLPRGLKLVSMLQDRKQMTQMLLVAALSLLATILLLRVFQSGVGLSLDPGLMYHRLLEFRLESAFIIFLFMIGVAATAVRLLVLYIPLKKAPAAMWTDVAWPMLGISLAGATTILSVAIWEHQWSRNSFSLIGLAVMYIVFEVRAWHRLRTQTSAGILKVGPILAFSLLAIAVVLGLNQRLLIGRGMNVSSLTTAVWEDLQLSFDTHQISYALLKDLHSSTPAGAQLFVVGDDYEVIFEIGLYASQFGQRQISVVTSNQQLVSDIGGEYPFLVFNPDPTGAFEKAEAPKQLILRKVTFDALIATGSATLGKPEQEKSSVHFESADEKRPPQVFGVIPSWANWVVAE